MSLPTNKLSRISALRPARAGVTGTAEHRENQAILRQMLDAELCRNQLGQHVALRNRFMEPRPATVGRRSLRLLLPGAGEDAADLRNWVFLDTETTGLAGGTGTYAFLVGLAWWEDAGFVIEQFFMQDYAEEPSLLAALADRLAERSVLVTYNGKSFDWPLLETRYRMTRAAVPTPPAAHLDLLHPARQIWRFRLKSLALSELERQVLGLERHADIPSSLIPSLYFDFLRGGPAEPLVAVFRHNQMDLRGLATLAVRVAEMLEDPESAGCEAAELYGISRILHRRGESRLAGSACERALLLGLPEEAGRSARRELAMMARQQRDFKRANEWWEQLAEDLHCGLLACEQLAIHHEHRAHDPARAANLVRKALAQLRESYHAGQIPHHSYLKRHSQLQHRLDRLTRKLSGRSRRTDP
jgi:uncharacterized protein YprB with RNaseH-like and TPR domain